MLEKMKVAIQDSVGERAEDIFYLAYLATTPTKQGHGYGTALCGVLADIVSRSVLALSLSVRLTTVTSLFDRRTLAIYRHTSYQAT